MRFSSGSQHHGPNLHSEANLRETKTKHMSLEKAYDRVLRGLPQNFPRDKVWKILREYGVDSQLLCAFKSFYWRPDVCVRVKGKQPKLIYVGVGLGVFCFRV